PRAAPSAPPRGPRAVPAELDALRRRVARLAPGVPLAETVHQPRALIHHDRGELGPEAVRDRVVAGLCGIGNPEAFRRTLAGLGARLCDFRTYPDHHAYTREDLEGLRAWA